MSFKMPVRLDSFVSERKSIHPMIYTYKDPVYPGCLKVSYTTIDVEKRVAQQYPTMRPGGMKPYEIVWSGEDLREDETTFDDHKIHHALETRGMRCMKGEDGGSTEFFRCGLEAVRAAYIALKTRSENVEGRTADVGMRPEQREAVEKWINAAFAFSQELVYNLQLSGFTAKEQVWKKGVFYR